MLRRISLLLLVALVGAACSSDAADTVVAEATDATESTETTETADEVSDDTEETDDASSDDDAVDSSSDADTTESATAESFTIEVWADNWMAVYVDGELVGEDSVSITTERSFNSEVFTFEAAYPFTLAIEAKDYKETDSGLEYIGESNQQMGDGGIIAQVSDSSGAIVSVTNADWQSLVVHRAPLNTDCESDSDPDANCEYEISETPGDWTSVDFDDSAWTSATEWSAADVDPKLGYDEISWDGSAQLIWGTDLEVDNTVLLRTTVAN